MGSKDRPGGERPWDEESQGAISGSDWSDDGAPAADGPHPFEEGETGRYERRHLLGKGGMGRVVSVLDRRLRRVVALKEVAEPTADSEARLAREAWITSQLEHPGVVPIHDAGRGEDGQLFYTMRLIRGSSLSALLDEAHDLTARLQLLRPFLDACQAGAYAHSVGIVHRDLKPANIMIGEFGETQVVDWGLARPSDSARGEAWLAAVQPDADLTQAVSGSVTGTPAYMSPEQASGEPADERSDVWSLGAVLYELLTDRPPFVGTDSRDVLSQVRTRSPDAIQTLAWLCGAAGDGNVVVWGVDPLGGFAELFSDQPAGTAVAKDCAFTADGGQLVTGGIPIRGAARYATGAWSALPALPLGHRDFPHLRRVVSLEGGWILGLSYAEGGPELWRADDPETLDSVRVPGRMFVDAETNHRGTAAILMDDKDQAYRLLGGDTPVLRDVGVRRGLVAVDIAQDDETVAFATGDQVELFHVASGETLQTLGPTDGLVRDVAFSPDGTRVAAAQMGGVVHVWDVETGQLVAILRGHTELVATLAFSPDGRWLATGSWDGHMRLWGLDTLDTPPGELVERFESAWQIDLDDALSAEVR